MLFRKILSFTFTCLNQVLVSAKIELKLQTLDGKYEKQYLIPIYVPHWLAGNSKINYYVIQAWRIDSIYDNEYAIKLFYTIIQLECIFLCFLVFFRNFFFLRIHCHDPSLALQKKIMNNFGEDFYNSLYTTILFPCLW